MQVAHAVRPPSNLRGLLLLTGCASMVLGAPLAAAPRAGSGAYPAAAQADGEVNAKGYNKAALQAMNVAKFHYKRGEFEQAALLLHSAFRIQPKAEFLFNAARAEHRAMKLNMAKRHFEHCLKLPDAPDAVRRRAAMHIKEIETVQRALAKARREASVVLAPPAPVTATVVRKPAPPAAPAWQTPAGWGGLGLGVALLGAGAWVWSSYAADQQALNDRVDDKDAAGKVVGIDWERYEAGQESLNSRAALRTGLIAGGAVAAAAGTWLLLTARDDPKASSWHVAPAVGRGVVASLRF